MTMPKIPDRTLPDPCPHCEGNGFIVIRDCTGEIQREETCLFCDGVGVLQEGEDEDCRS